MRLHRFIIPGIDLGQSELTIDDKMVVHQLMNVLRVRVGTKFIIGNGACQEAETIITSIKKHSILVRVVKHYTNTNEPQRDVILYCSVIKNEHFAMVVEKATEIGVKEIVPIIATRSVKAGLKLDRLKMIAKEAAEQSGRGVLPIIHPIMAFHEACEHAKVNNRNFLFDIGGPLQDHEKPFKSLGARIGVFIGPEGGWDDAERVLAEERGMTRVSLGTLTLRAETAAIVATYCIIHDICV